MVKTKKTASVSISARKEMSYLLCQHVAIRSQMRFLIKRLNDIFMQPYQKIAPSTKLNEQVSLYSYLLDDFQEAIRRHNALYEGIKMHYGNIFNEEIIIEQKEIEKQLDNVVWITHNAVCHRLQQDELNRCIYYIIERVNRICESIDVHMAKKERVLE